MGKTEITPNYEAYGYVAIQSNEIVDRRQFSRNKVLKSSIMI